MAALSNDEVRFLSHLELTRDGEDLYGIAEELNCSNFALNGHFVSGSARTFPAAIYGGNGAGHRPEDAILDVNIYPERCNGLRPTATSRRHRGCRGELGTLRRNIDDAIRRNRLAQQRCAEAMVAICARKNGLVPRRATQEDQYQIHMMASTWFGWDHWALSFKSCEAGAPRIFIQTTTGQPLSIGCDRIWDEHLPVSVTLGIDTLRVEQRNMVRRAIQSSLRNQLIRRRMGA